MTQQDRPLYTPDFPTRNNLDLQRSKIKFGDVRNTLYETTYTAAHRPFTHQDTRQSLDTQTLQRTHWNAGDLPGTTISEMHDKYRDFGTNCKREEVLTRDQMMRTSFNLSDGTPMQGRIVQKYIPADIQSNSNLREMNCSTHFNLKNPQAVDNWVSTNKEDFKPPNGKPAEQPNLYLNRGYGLKSCFEQMGAYPPQASMNSTTYVDYSKKMDPSERTSRTITLENGTMNIEQNTSNKWQRTNMIIGDSDSKSRYRTTMQDGIQPHGIVANDPRVAQQMKLNFQRSCINAGNNHPSVTTTTTQDALKPHPDFRPPELAPRTAFISHQDHRNWNGPISTTSRDAFQPKKAEYIPPVNNQLQRSHANFGDDTINEKRTLYQDTFKPPPPNMERVDFQALRDFHQGHHTNSSSGMGDHTEITTNQATYKAFPGFKPSEICDSLRGGKNIVQNEPRLNVRESEMKSSFVAHKYAPPQPIDNNLQKSHIQLQGSGEKWTTTQGDYFLFRTYKMPEQK
ncbi:hypothetical protein M9Y10_042461 [Tritrichomonas musculus]|uniref:Uncharacterized protein n=1 Tax=Tritrichomonas musculus TaxID=1915356 RepID=A0ABR2GIJ0_9EUKA